MKLEGELQKFLFLSFFATDILKKNVKGSSLVFLVKT